EVCRRPARPLRGGAANRRCSATVSSCSPGHSGIRWQFGSRAIVKFDDLTEDQRKAATSTARRTVVLGGAGSGKTTVALWCARLVLERESRQSWHRALFLTFSKAAVGEISGRATGAVGELEKRIEIHTFHSFAHRMLVAFGRYVGL